MEELLLQDSLLFNKIDEASILQKLVQNNEIWEISQGSLYGLLVISDASSGNNIVINVGSINKMEIISNPSDLFSLKKDTPNKVNIYKESNKLSIQNMLSTRSLGIKKLTTYLAVP